MLGVVHDWHLSDQVRTRWKTLRDAFVKEQRKVAAGQAPRWRLYEKMAFLKTFIRGVDHEVSHSLFRVTCRIFKNSSESPEDT